MNVTANELLEALQKEMAASPTGEQGHTGPEIAKMMRLSNPTAARAIKAMLDGGKMEVVTVARQRMNGTYYRLLGYRLKT